MRGVVSFVGDIWSGGVCGLDVVLWDVLGWVWYRVGGLVASLAAWQ